MPTIVKTPEAHDFLALVPHLAGFDPRNSIVLVAFRGNRTCGAMRFSLPTAIGTKMHRRIATSMLGMLSKMPGVDAVVPVVYTDDRFGRRIPYESFLREVLRRADFCGFLVRDALCVAADGWGSYLEPDCPSGGHPLDLIASSSVAERPELRAVGDLLASAALPPVRLDRSERIAHELRAMRADVDAGRIDRLHARFPRLADLALMMEHALLTDPEGFTDEDLALMTLLLQPPSTRDAVMLLWAFDLETGDRTFDLNERFHDGEDVSGDPDGALMLGEGRRPDPERIERAIGLLKILAAHAPRSARPPLLCMLAWLNWALGRASVGGVFLEAAVEIDSDYGLAELLQVMLRNGMLPEWAFEAPPGDGRDETITGR